MLTCHKWQQQCEETVLQVVAVVFNYAMLLTDWPLMMTDDVPEEPKKNTTL